MSEGKPQGVKHNPSAEHRGFAVVQWSVYCSCACLGTFFRLLAFACAVEAQLLLCGELTQWHCLCAMTGAGGNGEESRLLCFPWP